MKNKSTVYVSIILCASLTSTSANCFSKKPAILIEKKKRRYTPYQLHAGPDVKHNDKSLIDKNKCRDLVLYEKEKKVETVLENKESKNSENIPATLQKIALSLDQINGKLGMINIEKADQFMQKIEKSTREINKTTSALFGRIVLNEKEN